MSILKYASNERHSGMAPCRHAPEGRRSFARFRRHSCRHISRYAPHSFLEKPTKSLAAKRYICNFRVPKRNTPPGSYQEQESAMLIER